MKRTNRTYLLLFFPLVLLALYLTMAPSQAQPQTPIAWDSIRVIGQFPMNYSSHTAGFGRIKIKSDTILINAIYQNRNSILIPAVTVTGNSGSSWSPWTFIGDTNTTTYVTPLAYGFINEQGIYLIRRNLPSSPPGFAIFKTLNLGNSWVQTSTTAIPSLNILDVKGDTILVRYLSDSLSWTNDEGVTFAPRRLVEFNNVPNVYGYLATFNREWIFLFGFRSSLIVRRSPFSGSNLINQTILNPSIVWTEHSSQDCDNTNVFLTSLVNYYSSGTSLKAVLSNYSTDNGFSWSPADTLLRTESGHPVSVFTKRNLDQWAVAWYDTTNSIVIPGRPTKGGPRVRFSPYLPFSFYHTIQTCAIDTNSSIWFMDMSISERRIDLVFSSRRWQGVTGHFILKQAGIIHPDTILPSFTMATLQPEFLFQGDRFSARANVIDNDTVLKVVCVIWNVQQNDSLVFPFSYDRTQNYWGLDTVLSESQPIGRYTYAYYAFDRWNNLGIYPSRDPAYGEFEIRSASVQTAVETPKSISLHSFPNPSNQNIVFSGIIYPKNQQHNLLIHNIKGALVRELFINLEASGHFQVIWDGLDHSNRQVSNGVYFASLRGLKSKPIRIVLLK